MATPNSKYPKINLGEGFNSLGVKSISQAVIEAEDEIVQRASGVQFGLKSRLPKLNIAVGGGFQLDNIYLLAGASGSGKSMFRNLLESDFCDKSLNGNYPREFLLLNFQFEMSASSEVVRTFSSNIGLSYGEIMSAEKPFAQLGHYRDKLLEIANRPVFFVETSGNRQQMLATIHKVHLLFPNHDLVITYDHTLLVDFLDEKDEIELLAKLAKMAIKVKKNYPCCQILLGQLNDKIENPFRLTNQSLHYPTKTDVHGSKQLYWACDYVGIIHRPEELGIALYGRHNYPTQDLIAFHLIKARNGKIGLVRLRQQFAQGKIIEWA